MIIAVIVHTIAIMSIMAFTVFISLRFGLLRLCKFTSLFWLIHAIIADLL